MDNFNRHFSGSYECQYMVRLPYGVFIIVNDYKHVGPAVLYSIDK